MLIYLFLREKEVEGQREKERISSTFHTVSVQSPTWGLNS